MLGRASVLLRSSVFIRPGPRERMALLILTLAYVTSWSCRFLLTCGLHYRKAGSSSKDCKNASPYWKSSSNQLRSPKCCSCTNIKSRMAADCFAAAGRLQYTSFQTNSVDLNDALLLSIQRIVHLRPSAHERPSRHGPPFLGPFATILDVWAHGRFHTVLHSVLRWRSKRWWQPIMGLGVEGYSAAAPTSLDMTGSTTNKFT